MVLHHKGQSLKKKMRWKVNRMSRKYTYFKMNLTFCWKLDTKWIEKTFTYKLPVSQFTPWWVLGHLQVRVLSIKVQVPPFWHGVTSQRSISEEEKRWKVERMSRKYTYFKPNFKFLLKAWYKMNWENVYI